MSHIILRRVMSHIIFLKGEDWSCHASFYNGGGLGEMSHITVMGENWSRYTPFYKWRGLGQCSGMTLEGR